MLLEPWSITLFGGLRASQGDRIITRFRTQRTGALLAYLALRLPEAVPRERLTGVLWPEAPPEQARNGLRVDLSSLRRQLEPPGVAPGSVLAANRLRVGLNPLTVRTDVAEFNALLEAARAAAASDRQADLFGRAVALYQGDLLPHLYDEWEELALQHLRIDYRTRYEEALYRLLTLHEQAGRAASARDAALLLLHVAPYDEAVHTALMRAYASLGNPTAALDIYAQWQQTVIREFGHPPSAAARKLAELIQQYPQAEGKRSRSVETTDSPPVPASSPSPAPRLPLTLNRFFGRQEERLRIKRLLEAGGAAPAPRLVTLTGPGGSGKTRLAIEAAHALAPGYEGAIWFVPLETTAAPERIADTIAGALGLPRSEPGGPLEAVCGFLHGKRALLLLDNYEQLLITPQGAAFIMRLLARLPQLTCLITSRQRLAIQGETEFPVLPLPVPTPGEREADTALAPVALSAFACVQLFTDRAREALPDFEVTDRNAAPVAALMARLEGIPLAIQLAAALIRTHSPARILDRLAAGLNALQAHRETVPARHASLWLVLEESYRLLPARLKTVFAQLSVFRGGWTAEAAAQVCDGTAAGISLETEEMSDLLEALRARSLILTEVAESGPRFRMLETVREFAGERLRAAEQESLSSRHAAWCLRYVTGTNAKLFGPEHKSLLDQMEAEMDNYRAALTWCAAERGDHDTGILLAVALYNLWEYRGYLREGEEWLKGALATWQEQNAAPPARAAALLAAGIYAGMREDAPASLDLYQRSVAAYRELGDYRQTAKALLHAGYAAHRCNDRALACRYCRESLELGELHGDDACRVEAYAQLALVEVYERVHPTMVYCADLEPARADYERCLNLSNEMQYPRGIAWALNGLGLVALLQDDYATANEFFLRALTAYRALGYRRSSATVLYNLGRNAEAQGALEDALRYYEQSNAIARNLGSPLGIANVLGRMGNIALLQANHRAAQTYFEQARAIYVEWNLPEKVEAMEAKLRQIADENS